jgi:hypothetical protein
MSYNHKTGFLIMWINGNTYRKNVGKFTLDTQGWVYVGTRPKNQKYYPFHGYLAGTSLLPYPVSLAQLPNFRMQVISRYFRKYPYTR